MRELLFKAKRTDNKEWAEGFHLEIDSISYILPKGKHLRNIVQVDPSIVCQYTELTDENGVDIFDGDKVRIYTAWTGEIFGYIVWCEIGLMLDTGTTIFDFVGLREKAEVIGNIHDKE